MCVGKGVATDFQEAQKKKVKQKNIYLMQLITKKVRTHADGELNVCQGDRCKCWLRPKNGGT